MTPSPRIIRVTCAIIRDNNKVLACQRGPDISRPLKWEFPGGKIRTGETEEACIVRELQEELGITAKALKKLPMKRHDYGDKIVELTPLLCRITQGTIALTEHADYLWDTPENIRNLDWSEADEWVVGLLPSLLADTSW